jgi:hypothetical protein
MPKGILDDLFLRNDHLQITQAFINWKKQIKKLKPEPISEI